MLFEEFELVTEPEQQNDANDTESYEQAEQRRLNDYETFLAEQKSKDDDLTDVPDEEFNAYTNQIDEDIMFNKFKSRIELDENQVNSYFVIVPDLSMNNFIEFFAGATIRS